MVLVSDVKCVMSFVFFVILWVCSSVWVFYERDQWWQYLVQVLKDCMSGLLCFFGCSLVLRFSGRWWLVSCLCSFVMIWVVSCCVCCGLMLFVLQMYRMLVFDLKLSLVFLNCFIVIIVKLSVLFFVGMILCMIVCNVVWMVVFVIFVSVVVIFLIVSMFSMVFIVVCSSFWWCSVLIVCSVLLIVLWWVWIVCVFLFSVVVL